MRYIDKSQRCIEFDEYMNGHSPMAWNEFRTDIKLKLHQHLWREQQGLCIYCQQQVPEKKEIESSNDIRSHIEHIRPQKPYTNLVFCYKNLSISCEGFDCNTEDTKPKKEFCEHRKGNEYDEDKFLNPVECETIEDYFIYDIEGRIYPNERDQKEVIEKAKYMIKILDLNNSGLVKMRKTQYDLIIEQANEFDNEFDIENFLSPNYNLLPAFYSMLKQLFL